MTQPRSRETPIPTAETVDSFRLVVSRIRDYAIFLLDPSGNVVSWNEGAELIKGYAPDEIIGRNIATFYTPEDQQRGHPAELLAEAGARDRVEEEGWRVRKDGTRFWADVVITAIRDASGNLIGFGKVTRDLTERREAEIALAELSGRLLQLQDDERRNVARELHDSTSPLITGLLARLYNARQRARPTDPELAGVIEDSLSNAESLATVLRTVSSLLHPPLLDEGGLLASLRWYLEAFGKRTGLRVETSLPQALSRMPADIEITMFRIVQECLTTLVRHSGATQAKVELKKVGAIMLVVRLNAELSVDQAELRATRGELGVAIAGMRERMRQLQGTLEVTKGRGETVITAELPGEPRVRKQE